MNVLLFIPRIAARIAQPPALELILLVCKQVDSGDPVFANYRRVR